MSRRGSPLDAEPCRQCSSFSDYVKVARRKTKTDGDIRQISSDMRPRRTDCPLDREELGRASWGLLHTIAAKYPERPEKSDQRDIKQFLNLFATFYPCDHCAEDFKKELITDPPKTSSQDALSQWLCRVHNRVNVKLGKEVFDCSKVNERWRDGWLDGSCDY